MVLYEGNEKRNEAAQVLFWNIYPTLAKDVVLSYVRIVEARLCICVYFYFFIIRKLLISWSLMAQEESRPVLYAFGAVG